MWEALCFGATMYIKRIYVKCKTKALKQISKQTKNNRNFQFKMEKGCK